MEITIQRWYDNLDGTSGFKARTLTVSAHDIVIFHEHSFGPAGQELTEGTRFFVRYTNDSFLTDIPYEDFKIMVNLEQNTVGAMPEF